MTINGIDLTVKYTSEGKYITATHDSPAEYPDIEIKSIHLANSHVDITSLLYEGYYYEIQDELYEIER